MPAFDVLRLGSNEGNGYGKQLNLLFAASGDLRNVVKTLAEIPSSYNEPVTVTVNDRDFDIVARNAILLLIALVLDDMDEAIDCIIHIWYSALIRRSDLEILQQRIRPLIESVCAKVKGKQSTSILAKTFTFGQRSLRLVLQKSSWDDLLAYMSVPAGLTAEQANRIRVACTLAESRKDYRHRQWLMQSPSHRVAKERFRQDGVLLPFGSSRDEFQEPNPTLYQSIDIWPMKDASDPLSGWSPKDVEDTSSGPATADIYGKLFYFLRGLLRSFILQCSKLHISFRLFHLDFSDLNTHLEPNYFSRIEVSNVSDNGYVGIHRTVAMMAPLLQGPLVNRHATLITLFMNAVDDTMTQRDRLAAMSPQSQPTRRLLKYLPINGPPEGSYDPAIIKMSYARANVGRYDDVFDRFMKKMAFSEIEEFLSMAVKDKHTVIDKWPYQLKLRPGQPGAQEEFDRVLGACLSGTERYVEWRRTKMYREEMDDEAINELVENMIPWDLWR
ncbi:hypothetical protein A9Z42_0086210 [Trichoderma parareesei]|uniref:DUF4470 domain-containing protein n=1 Tax=Trichoderma parareesei TaxID=858221 RepID=A0A2H2ZLR2_TRIPA|nr:hypothetical protein A9Z42_0086210 [Trichoderma parareesei]